MGEITEKVESLGAELAQENFGRALNKLFLSNNQGRATDEELSEENIKVRAKEAIESGLTYYNAVQTEMMEKGVNPKLAQNIHNSQLPSPMDLNKPIELMKMAMDVLDGAQPNPSSLIKVTEILAQQHGYKVESEHAEKMRNMPRENFLWIIPLWYKSSPFYDEMEWYDRTKSNARTVASTLIAEAPKWAQTAQHPK